MQGHRRMLGGLRGWRKLDVNGRRAPSTAHCVERYNAVEGGGVDVCGG
jgi:hypothetical protein